MMIMMMIRNTFTIVSDKKYYENLLTSPVG